MERIELELGDPDHIDIQFGVGAELQVVGVGSRDGAGSCRTALVNWTGTSLPLRQVTVEAGPSLRKLHTTQHAGYVDTEQEGLQQVATAISVALSNATADVQELEADSEADGDRLDVEQHVAAACVAAVWDLLDCLVFQDRGPHGYVTEALARWATTHCNVIATDLPDSLVRQFGEIYAAMQLAGASRESFRGTACWFLLQQLLLTGDVQRAYLLLTAHLNAQSQPMEQATLDDACEHFVLENLARCVMSMPRYNSESYSSMEQFQSQLSEWMASLEQLEQSLPALISRQFPDVPMPKELLMHVKETVHVCTASGDQSETARWRASPSILHFFLSHLLYSQPGQCLNSSLAGTLDVAETMMKQRGQSGGTIPTLHKITAQIIRAAAKHEPMQMLLAANTAFGAGSWVAAHAAMLLYRDPRFADALEEALPADDVGSTAHMCLQPGEYFTLRAAADLASGPDRLWAPVATSLLSCMQAGRAGTISIAERWPCTAAHSTEADAIMLHLESVGLLECSATVKWSAAMAALHEGRLAEAVALAPPGDADAHSAFAPFLLAAMRQHVHSKEPLSNPPAVLVTVAELSNTFIDPLKGPPVDTETPRGAAGIAVVPASWRKSGGKGWVQDSWQCVAAYASLCQACAALGDAQESATKSSGKSIVPKNRGSSSTGRLQDAVQEAARNLLEDCPADIALRTLYKLRPLLLPEQHIFSSNDLHLFVQRMHDACMHGGPSAQMQAPDEEALRTELLTACVLASTA